MNNAELLQQIPLFEGLSGPDRAALAERLKVRTFAANASVFARGDAGNSMYIVRSGLTRIFLPGDEAETPPVVIKDARAGEYFGEISLFDDKPRSASVETLLDTELLELTRDVFEEYLASSPRAAMSILSEMAERIRETNALLSQRASKDAVKEIEANLSWGEHLADRVASLNGSWKFIFALLAMTCAWAALNHFVPEPFDRYPYTFFNLVLAILVALQGPLIVMSQNREAKKDRAQAETDFRVNLKNEVGIETLLREVGALRAETNKRFEVLERSMRGDRIRAEIPIKKPGGPLGPS